jgi:uncharacterized ferredoxin-like protein
MALNHGDMEKDIGEAFLRVLRASVVIISVPKESKMSGLKTVAELMEIAARTAPKAKGEDFVVVAIVEGAEAARLAQGMVDRGEKQGETDPRKGFLRDGGNIAHSEIVVLIGIKDATPCGLNCGACGHEKCMKINTVRAEFNGPQCVHRMLDMGIALGSAVKTASIMNVDNRIMYRIGAVAKQLGMIDADVAMGVPLSVTGKSIYFDR